MTPFKVIYGYCSDFTVLTGPPTKFPTLNLQLKKLHEIYKEAKAALHA
jgi:hypothetical protein